MTLAAGGLGQSTAVSLLVLLIFAALSVVSLRAIVRRQGWTWAAPYVIGAGVMATIGILGALFLPGLAHLGPEYIHKADFPVAIALSVIAVAIPAFSFGSLLGLGRRTAPTATEAFTGIQVSDPIRRARVVKGSLWLSWFTIAVLVIGIGGPGAVLRRSDYLVYDGPKIMALANILELVAAALLGFARPLAKANQRRWCNFLVVLLMIIAFSTGSRRLALIPLLVWLGGMLAAPRKRKLLAAPFLGVLALILSGVALFDRGQPGSGLLPYLDAVLSNPGDVVHGFGAQLANGLAPFAGIGYGATRPPPTAAGIAYSLTPSPRGLVDANNVGPGLLLSAHHPSPALGVMYTWGGPIAVFGYMFIAGLILGAAGRLARQLSERAASVGSIVMITVSAYFCLRALQYSLRTDTRLLWYMLAATLVVGVVTLPLRKKPVPWPGRPAVVPSRLARPVAADRLTT